MNLAARVLRFSRENPGVYVPLLVFWVLQAAPEALSRVPSTASADWVQTLVGLTRLTFPLFMAATAALIREGIELGRAKGRHLLRRTYDLTLRAAIPWLMLLTLAQTAWRMQHVAGMAFFLAAMLFFAFLPEALAHEESVTTAIEKSVGLLHDHPGPCALAIGAPSLLAGIGYLLGVWQFVGGAAFDFTLPASASPIMAVFAVTGVWLMIYRTFMYREIRVPDPVGIDPGW